MHTIMVLCIQSVHGRMRVLVDNIILFKTRKQTAKSRGFRATRLQV